jgi:hypothetical protein
VPSFLKVQIGAGGFTRTGVIVSSGKEPQQLGESLGRLSHKGQKHLWSGCELDFVAANRDGVVAGSDRGFECPTE